jgi:argininosuccinate lyase
MIGDDARQALTLQASLQSRATRGGTAPARVREQIERHRQRLG